MHPQCHEYYHTMTKKQTSLLLVCLNSEIKLLQTTNFKLQTSNYEMENMKYKI